MRTRRLLLLLLFFFLSLGWYHVQVRSANLTNASITLSTPRLSFSGILANTNTVGSSIVNLNTTPGAAPSTSSANLFEADTVLIGASQYKVASVSTGGTFTITGLSSTPSIDVLQTGDADAGDAVIASRSATITSRWTTASAIRSGSIRVLIPAAATNDNDALPDQTGWDFGGPTSPLSNVTCPSDVSGYDFWPTGIASAAAITRAGRVYHTLLCKYSGTGGNGTNFTSTSNEIISGSNFINPSPAVGHAEGYADSYKFVVEHLDATDTIIDATIMDVAVIESVRVTAVVPPQITFRIVGINSGVSRCGNNTSVSSTATLVPLGELLIDSFKYAAQELIVSTNAENGYTVTTIEDNQLHRVGEACSGDATTGGCIPDSVGNNGTMAQSTSDKWTNTSVKGFGYSMQDNTVGTADMQFHHALSSGNCDGTSGGCWRQYADLEAGQTPISMFTSSGPVDQDSAYVCYKAIIGATQVAGDDYSTGVTYRATATF